MAGLSVSLNAKIFNVYYIAHPSSGMGYVGITGWSVQRRFQRHGWNAQHGRSGQLYDAMRAYGLAAFTVELIAQVTSWEDACETEIRLIEEFETKAPQGFNLTGGGDGNFGYAYTDEVRARMSASAKKRKLSAEHRRKIGEASRGRTHRPESIVAMRVAKLGKKATTETKEKMSLARKGGATPEALDKIRGQKRSPEQIERMRAGMIGKKRSPEACANVAAAAAVRTARLRSEGRLPKPPSALGRAQSAETKAKMTASQKARWAAKKAAAET